MTQKEYEQIKFGLVDICEKISGKDQSLGIVIACLAADYAASIYKAAGEDAAKKWISAIAEYKCLLKDEVLH